MGWPRRRGPHTRTPLTPPRSCDVSAGEQSVYASSAPSESAAPSSPLVTGKPSELAPAPGPTQPSEAETPAPPPPHPSASPAPPGLAVSVDRYSTNCTGTGFATDPVDCNVYHRCDWGIKTTYVCPEPLHFHPGPNQCDWPELAGCKPSELSDTDGGKAQAQHEAAPGE